jgi:hypothetical protein
MTEKKNKTERKKKTERQKAGRQKDRRTEGQKD